MNTNTPFAILSAEHGHFTEEVNTSRTEALRSQLKSRGAAFAPVDGYYKGVHEQSFIVLLPDGGETGYTFQQVMQLADRYSQESVLYVDANRVASLVTQREVGAVEDISRRRTVFEIIGKWTDAGKDEPIADAWTFDPWTKRHYVVVPS